jgi:L-ribulokinase
MAKYSIGVDYGTESGRAVLVDVSNGRELATAVHKYGDCVIDRYIPGTKIKLGPDWALQNPADYLAVLAHTIPAVLKQAKVSASDVIGVGTDFTACTMMPINDEGTPLCMLPKWRNNPHSWVKLWKHHAAQYEADKLNRIARQRNEPWLKLYGGKISSEWMMPKIMQIHDEAPEIYKAATRFIEAADWIVLQMTGQEKRNSCTAGYKAIWHKKKGYPSKDFFKALAPGMENLVDEKLTKEVTSLGEKAGEITAKAAKLTGLKEGTAVCVGNVDAHVAVPAAGITEPGKMLMIMGTSICHMVMGKKEQVVPGMCGVVEDGILPGLQGFEAGQSCVGDHFAWFTKNCVPESYEAEARKRKISIHDLLVEKASKLDVGESGLLALDWWNGNRSILVDVDLTGMMMGMTLQTRPEEIYRALIEATAFGTYIIVENFQKHGVPVDELYACGGLPERNNFLMQIYADVTNRVIKVARSAQTPALGSSLFAAVAAGKKRGGYDTIFEAAKKMGGVKDKMFKPRAREHKLYRRLFDEYVKMHDYLGRGTNDVMKRLKKYKSEVSKEGHGH